WTLLDLRAADEAATRLMRGLDAGEDAGGRDYLLRCVSQLAWAEYLRGDRGRAQAWAERSEELLGEVTTPPDTMFLHGAHAYLAVARAWIGLGEPTRAANLLAPLLDAADRAGWQETIAYASLVLALALSAAGD